MSSSLLHASSLYIACRSSHYQHMYTVWKNGISWTNMMTSLQLLNSSTTTDRVLVAMSYMEETLLKYAELRSSIISLVRHLQQEHCASVEVHEFLISPDHVQQYPFDSLPCGTLFDIYQVAHSILRQKPVILSYKDGKSRLRTQSLHFDPYTTSLLPFMCVSSSTLICLTSQFQPLSFMR